MRSEDEIKREIEIIKIAKDVNKNGYPDYARNFICDFILGKTQQLQQQKLF